MRSAVYNLAGNVAPMLCAVIAIPRILRALGTERFGVVSLVWMFVGYFSLFDFGLGRALTRAIAEALGKGEDERVPGLVWTGLVLMTAFGAVGGVVLALASPFLVTVVLHVPQPIRAETLSAFRALTFLIPVVTSVTALQGVLEAKQLFGWSNAVRVPLGMFAYLGPLLAVSVAKSVLAVVAFLAVGRATAWVVFFFLCLRAYPELRQKVAFRKDVVGPLVRFGGWMTITNLVGPIMVYMDRFFIGAVASVAVVAYYTTPYEVLSKLLVIPSGIVGVLFPAFASTYATDRSRTVVVFERGFKYVGLIMFPIALVVSCFASEGLSAWLGPEMSLKSAGVMRWLMIGIFVNSLAYVPFWALQGIGRSDLPAKMHAVEVPLYLTGLVFLVRTRGVEGAAIAWAARAALDAVLLLFLVGRVLAGSGRSIRRLAPVVLFALVALSVAAWLGPFASKAFYVVAALSAYLYGAWNVLLEADERQMLLAFVRRLSPRSAP